MFIIKAANQIGSGQSTTVTEIHVCDIQFMLKIIM